MILRLTLTILGLSSLLLSQEETEKSVSVTQTRRLDFPTDGIRTSGAAQLPARVTEFVTSRSSTNRIFRAKVSGVNGFAI